MDENQRQRLQELVDAIHLTCEALARTWGPKPMPRGWPSFQLGDSLEAAMFVPYVTPIPQYVPSYNGLLHAGLSPMGGFGYGHPGYMHHPMNPLLPTPFMPYGLSHMGYYPPVGFSGNYNTPYMHPQYMHPQYMYTHPQMMGMNPGISPMQPAWSNPMPSPMNVPNHG